MDSADIWLIVALATLIVAAAVLGAAEAGLLRVRRVTVEVAAEDGDRRAAILVRLIDDLPNVLNTVLLVVLFIQIGAATIAGALAAKLSGSVAVTIASFALTIVLFVYTEAIPKTYAVRNPERVALLAARVLRGLTALLRPVVRILVWFADLQAPGTGIASPVAPTEEELRRLASEAAATGTIEEVDRVLIEKAFLLGDKLVHEIMVPRLDVVGVPAGASVRSAIDEALDSGHRRLLVWEGDLDHVLGIVRVRDLVSAMRTSPDVAVDSVATPPLVVPQSNRVLDVLELMQDDGRHLAVVVDEHGGTEGIVTIEDVVSELFGQVADEGAVPTAEIIPEAPGQWLVAGSTDVVDLAAAVEHELPEGEWNTAAGVVIGLAGRIPTSGETFHALGLKFEVVETERNRVTLIRISQDG